MILGERVWEQWKVVFFFNIEMNLEKYLWKFSQKPVRHKKKPETCVKT